ncbi:rhomboid-domain-containing protein [Aureobasidium pullulans]|nr:rhomboid-domain-containing protein [Aureobasidium pullulans]THW27646.1 rhomboid-domain-containing protein [Aureobasidium pullulans]THW66057.1 rhomboid-domain-containing protein [Aureobasidium pullulans]THW80494.1 rhomboid-domain-containing protein [Aureobasidium pullulans]THY32208.1 rhomboid-domain-containing protein [Aureobasidium pullulans]
MLRKYSTLVIKSSLRGSAQATEPRHRPGGVTVFCPTVTRSFSHEIAQMASRDYYNTSTTNNNHPGYNSYTTHASPFDDNQYPSYSSSYNNLSHQPTPSDGRDPFQDDNAVPMHNYHAKHSSQSSTAPVITPEYNDPFVRDAKPRTRSRPRNTPAPKGWRRYFTGRVTWVCYFLTLVQIIVFIVEIAKNAVLTKSPIEIHPQFNPMIGPSPYVLINMGARYQPCMHNMHNVQDRAAGNISWPCPWATSNTGDDAKCTLSQLCGFGGVPEPHAGGSITDHPYPNQWYRFIIPIFLHAGIIHIGFNMLLQMTLGRDMERSIGSVRFTLVYFSAGIFGFVLGGNFAATGIASTGCSGSLFGIMALTLLELLYTWRERQSPIKDLMFILVDVIISFVLGLLPGLDNFSHIGGFLMGLVLGICLLRSPNALRRRTGEDEPPYSSVGAPAATQDAASQGLRVFIKQPAGFFKGRRAMWWVWWIVRALALLGVLIGFIVLLKNFYVWRTGCTWCKYLSCIDVNNWCDVGNLQFSNTTSKRDLLALGNSIFLEPMTSA